MFEAGHKPYLDLIRDGIRLHESVHFSAALFLTNSVIVLVYQRSRRLHNLPENEMAASPGELSCAITAVGGCFLVSAKSNLFPSNLLFPKFVQSVMSVRRKQLRCYRPNIPITTAVT